MLLQIEEKRIEPDVNLVELVGRFALGRESQRIETIVDEMLKAGRLKTILDMSKVDYIDSAGIGLIALSAGRLKEAGGRLIVVAPEGRVLHLMKMTQVSLIVTVADSVDDAVKAMS